MEIDWLSIMQRISCLFCYIKHDLTYFTYFLNSFCNFITGISYVLGIKEAL